MRVSMFCLLLLGVALSEVQGQSDFMFIAPELEVPYSPGTESVTFEVGFSIWQQSAAPVETQGFSMGVAHDPALIQAVDIEYGSAVVIEPWGTPDFFGTDVVAGGWTAGVVYSFYGGWTVAFPDPGEAVTVTYTTAPGAAYLSGSGGVTCPLSWTHDLGSPPVATVVVVGGASWLPDFADGAVTLVASQFIRGDMNGDGTLDISDVFAAESYLFVSGPVPECLGALDSNSDGGVDIADIIHLLSYLFVQGEAPAVPFPDCGPNPGSLSCESYSCP